MIVTFYSYKGGVGRSMAMANVAEWYRRQGLRVVVVDWDLEAPGLESFFTADATVREAMQARLGLVDMLQTYRELFPGLARPASAFSQTEAGADAGQRLNDWVTMLGEALPPLRHVLAPVHTADDKTLPPLWLLNAGKRSADRFNSYAETVQQFDWTAFYQRFEGEAYFEWLRRQLSDPELADVVLIDSRTGVAEMSGVCTRQLADVVVMFSAPNDQNLDGVAKMARSFTRTELASARMADPIQLVMVPARVDVAEGRPVDLFEARFHDRLDGYLPAAFRAVGADFARLRIPYISAYAFSERLAVGDPQGVKALQQAYAELALHLVLLAPASSPLRLRCAGLIGAHFGLPSVMVVAMSTAMDDEATRLREALAQAGLIVLPAPVDPAMALEIAQTEDSGPRRQALSVVVVFEEASASELRRLARRAGELGVALYGASPGPLNPERMPEGLPHGLTVISLRAGIADLVRRLQSPAPVRRVPMLAPPQEWPLIGRDRELAVLRAGLLDAAADTAGPRSIVLVGMGGAGKTAIARTACNDATVRDAFDGGVLWLSLGPQPDLRAGLTKLLTALEGPLRGQPDLDELQRRLAESLRERRCLLVIDDVESAASLERIPRGGPGCVTLISTRSREVAAAGGMTLEVGGLSAVDAGTVLLDGLPTPEKPATAQNLADRLGGFPLALQSANRLLRLAVQQGSRVDTALTELDERLQREGLAAVDPTDGRGPGESIMASMMQATEHLAPGDRQRLYRLAKLPEGASFKPASLAAALDLSAEEAVAFVQRLQSLGWLGGDGALAVVHPLARALFVTLARREDLASSRRSTRSGASGQRVYISYRRGEASAYAARIQERLAGEFGAEAVFLDAVSIAPGEAYAARIDRAIEQATAVVAVMGPDWISGVSSPSGYDFVVRELSGALARRQWVIPLLVGGAAMPRADALPAPIRELADRQALVVGDASFQRDMDALIEAIGRAVPSSRSVSAPEQRSGERFVLGSLLDWLMRSLSRWK